MATVNLERLDAVIRQFPYMLVACKSALRGDIWLNCRPASWAERDAMMRASVKVRLDEILKRYRQGA